MLKACTMFAHIQRPFENSVSLLKLILSGDIKYCKTINADISFKFTGKSKMPKTYIDNKSLGTLIPGYYHICNLN